MASEQTFSDWYFAYCQANNRTPTMEEVWDGRATATSVQPVPASEPVAQWQMRETEEDEWQNIDADEVHFCKVSRGYHVRALGVIAAPTAPASAPATPAPIEPVKVPEPLYSRQYEGMDGVDYDKPAPATQDKGEGA